MAGNRNNVWPVYIVKYLCTMSIDVIRYMYRGLYLCTWLFDVIDDVMIFWPVYVAKYLYTESIDLT